MDIVLTVEEYKYVLTEVFKAEAEKHQGKCIKTLRFDRGGEYLLKEFVDYLSEEGIESQLSALGSTKQNVPHRIGRVVRQPDRYMFLGESYDRIPNELYTNSGNYCETLQDKDAELWLKAMKSDMESEYSNHIRKFFFVLADSRVLLRACRSEIKPERSCRYDPNHQDLRAIPQQAPSHTRNVVFNKKAMLQSNQEEEKKQMLEKCSSNEHVVLRAEMHGALARETSTSEALNIQEKGSWMETVVEDMKSLHKNQMWDLVEHPTGKR
ncbi:uncharacterized protein LOC131151343 [Malania oleifera]|uniref:uncharacterized protein LOC131151343 n=1 Tax=Malania oleifera TaxID=397392 RepID=UPI0025ADE191|nr:uncharacterized protein LOC131151343 [Malania oleifera]